jgi:AAA-like domain/PD-(D/E)XK nuclease superfamily
MKKEFNITGVCFPHLHYMMDTGAKMAAIMDMVERGQYFIINRPRQYGKTTALQFLQNDLEKSNNYFPIRLSFQGIDSKWYESDEAFATMFVDEVMKMLKFTAPDLASFLEGLLSKVEDMNGLSEVITQLVHKVDKKLVLLIDEVDASSNFLPFLSFLGMLRTKYLERFSPIHATFHSIVLTGVHDIKSLKSKMRSEDQTQYNSPWNIAADFEVEMSFNPAEIAPMLEEYRLAEQVEMEVKPIAERLYYFTSGYPFLVSKLCKIIAEKLLPQKAEKRWVIEDVDRAVNLLLKENNTNFDSLIKNLENNPALYDLVYRVIIEGDVISFNPDEPLTNFGRMYGIFKENGRLAIHNRIYEQRLYNYMTVKTEINYGRDYNFSEHFKIADNGLDIAAVLLKFQQFMQSEHDKKDQDFLERNARLVFLSFLNPILNGKGHTFKEPQISEEKRLDVVVTYFQHKYIIELKRWYGEKAHQAGLAQLSDYLDRQHLKTGFLLIFEHKKEKSWRQEWMRVGEKEVFGVWV